MKKDHNYMKPVIELAKDIFHPGEIKHINVFHDDWCPKLKGGVCNCKPDVREADVDDLMR